MRRFFKQPLPNTTIMRLFVDQLTNVDFSYLCPDRGLVGETWLANFSLEGELDSTGMICDFSAVKSRFRQWLDTYLDHRLAVPTQSPALSVKQTDEQCHIEWQSSHGRITMTAPSQAVALIPVQDITPTACANWVISEVKALMPEQVSTVELDFSTEAIAGAFYHYTHGLKKHDGNCQRIAHGHRSTIGIWVAGQKRQDLEQEWANLWQDIYIGTREDIVTQNDTLTKFAYSAQQGEFELTIPTKTVYIIDEDSTVEFIAQHICAKIKRKYCEKKVVVKAFEGFGKGAIAEA